MKQEISKKSKKKLAAYSSAAGLGAFAAAGNASATIVSSDLSGAPVNLGPTSIGYFSQSVSLDIDGGGDDVIFSVYADAASTAFNVSFAADGFGGSDAMRGNALSDGFRNGYSSDPLTAFDLGDSIQSGSSVGGYAPTHVNGISLAPSASNNSFNGANKYFGVITSKGNYAWIELNIQGNYNTITDGHLGLSILGWGYEDSGSDITAGAAASPVPEPSTYALGLGLLALGAAGIRARRSSTKAK